MSFAEIKGFMAIVQKRRLSCGQIALWYALHNAGELSEGREWFSISGQELCVMTGLSRRAVLKCREELKALGLIDFQARTTKATQYKLEDVQEALSALEESAQADSAPAMAESAQVEGTIAKSVQVDVGPTLSKSAQAEPVTLSESAQVTAGGMPAMAKSAQNGGGEANALEESAQAEGSTPPIPPYTRIENIYNKPQKGNEMGNEENARSNARKRKGRSSAPKNRYAEFVSMTEAEYAKLTAKYGEAAAQRMIEILDNHKGASGRTYRDDYRAILKWVVTAFQEEQFRLGKLRGKTAARDAPMQYTSDGFLESLEDKTR